MFKPNNIGSVQKLMIADIKKELRLQGHYDTGKLEQSFREYEAVINNEIILQAYALGYITDLEEGVPANKIRVSEADFKNLTAWVQRKIGATTPAEATAIAASIVRKWKKEGKPLAGANEYSSTGKTTGAIADAFEANEDKYYNRLDNVVFDELDLEFLKTKEETI